MSTQHRIERLRVALNRRGAEGCAARRFRGGTFVDAVDGEFAVTLAYLVTRRGARLLA
jgi:hypothetical protein